LVSDCALALLTLNGKKEASNNIMTTRVILHTVTAVFIIPHSHRTELLIKQESSYGTIISQQWSKIQKIWASATKVIPVRGFIILYRTVAVIAILGKQQCSRKTGIE